METIMRFKRFNPTESGLAEAMQYMTAVKGINGCVIEVRIMQEQKGKQKKVPARGLLKELVKANGTAVWEQGAYRFCFDKNEYYRNGRSLYFTAGEAVFLYRWLVEGCYLREHKHFLRNLRSKFGTSFLAEAAHV
jgi:hypothetical protein